MDASLVIARWSGIGDVCMALCAAHAWAKKEGSIPGFWTAPALRPLARACPWVRVLDRIEDAEGATYVDLSDCAHGLGPEHEVTSMARRLGVPPTGRWDDRSLDLVIDAPMPSIVADALQVDRPGTKAILLHPGVTDPNRSWPAEHWVELANRLLVDGHVVALIGGEKDGSPLRAGGRFIHPHGSGRLTDLIGKLSLLETVQAMRLADIVVSSDGGPVQLAGASEAWIVGLYSVASVAWRAPWRHGVLGWRMRSVPPSCLYFPCYGTIADGPTWIASRDKLMEEGHLALGTQLAHWCPKALVAGGTRYRCMQNDITPHRVFSTIGDIVADGELVN